MYLTTTRRPHEAFNSLRRLSAVLDEAFGGFEQNGSVTAAWYPACDVFEDKDAVKIVAELPGVRPDEVKLSIENNVLTIRGEKKQQAEERNERVHRYERSYGMFERSFALPHTIDTDKIEAGYENGVLTVTVPKAERARPREIAVKVS